MSGLRTFFRQQTRKAAPGLQGTGGTESTAELRHRWPLLPWRFPPHHCHRALLCSPYLPQTPSHLSAAPPALQLGCLLTVTLPLFPVSDPGAPGSCFPFSVSQDILVVMWEYPYLLVCIKPWGWERCQPPPWATRNSSSRSSLWLSHPPAVSSSVCLDTHLTPQRLASFLQGGLSPGARFRPGPISSSAFMLLLRAASGGSRDCCGGVGGGGTGVSFCVLIPL